MLFKDYKRHLFFKKTIFFFTTYKDGNFQEENIIKYVKNLFRLEKLKNETIDTTIKDMKNLFRLEKGNKTIKDRIIINIRNLFEHGDIKDIFRFKKNNKIIKDRILRDIRNLFEHEEEENYYQPVTIILNMKVKVIEIKQYQLKNILIKLDPV